MNTPKRIVLDLDGVVCNWRKDLLDFMGLSYYYYETTEWDFWKQLPVTREEFFRQWNEFTKSGRLACITPINGAIEGVHQIIRWGHELSFMTSRSGETKGQTFDWLLSHAFLYVPIRFCVDKHVLLQDMRVDMFVDDAPRQIEKAMEIGIRTVVFDWPYNKNVGGERVTGRTDKKKWANLLKLIGE